MIGRLLEGRYLIKGQIGEGGMASVYTAEDKRLDRRVAIKILHPKMAGDPELRRRFLLEAKTLSTIDHPNIVKIFDYSGDTTDSLWIVTEILRGFNLSQYVQKFRKNIVHPVIGSFIIEEVSKALNYAHSKGIFHRDVKPENIFILHDGRVKLMDFGIAKDINRNNITMTGTIMGSPSYMPPEQIKGQQTDARSDIYSLCIMFYEVITGRLPFEGSHPVEVINKISIGKFLKPNEIASWVPTDINNIIVKGMAAEPANRYQSISSLTEDLRQYLNRFRFDDSDKELARFSKDPRNFERRLKKTVKISPPKKTALTDKSRISKRATANAVGRKPAIQQNYVRRYEHMDPRKAPRGGQNYRPPQTMRAPRHYHHPPTRNQDDQSSLFYMAAIVLTLAILGLSFAAFLKLYQRLEAIKDRKGQHALLQKEQPKKSEISLKKSKIKVFFTVQPSGLITLDGRIVGRAQDPIVKSGLMVAPGRHTIKIVESGFRPFSKTINISQKRNRFKFILRKAEIRLPLTVETSSLPAWITIKSLTNSLKRYEFKLTNKKQKFMLIPGVYDITINRGSQKIRRKIEITDEGITATIVADFEGDL